MTLLAMMILAPLECNIRQHLLTSNYQIYCAVGITSPDSDSSLASVWTILSKLKFFKQYFPIFISHTY